MTVKHRIGTPRPFKAEYHRTKERKNGRSRSKPFFITSSSCLASAVRNAIRNMARHDCFYVEFVREGKSLGSTITGTSGEFITRLTPAARALMSR